MALEVEPGVTAGDYLAGFLLGTRAALYESGRESITITVDRGRRRARSACSSRSTSARSASTPRSSTSTPTTSPASRRARRRRRRCWRCRRRSSTLLGDNRGKRFSVDEIAQKIGAADDVEHVYKILEHVAANPDHGVVRSEGSSPFTATYGRA